MQQHFDHREIRSGILDFARNVIVLTAVKAQQSSELL